MRKTYAMIAIILFMISVSVVEDAYQEMTGRESSLVPKVRRIDASYITVLAFGEQRYINTANIFTEINTIDYLARSHAKKLFAQIMTTLGLAEEEEPIREAYGLEIL